MGGARMTEAGVRLLADVTEHAVVGTGELLTRLPWFVRAFRSLCQTLRSERPRALVLIDFPEFNLLLARVARRLGVPTVYFIPPQLWAWRPWRARLIARLGIRVLAVFPFEAVIYETAGARVEFVGHPLLDSLPVGLDRARARADLGISEDAILIGLLPGSRQEEVERLLPAMAEAAGRIRERFPVARFLAAPAPSVDPGLVTRLLRAAPVEIRTVQGRAWEVMAASDLLLVASGTATLEAALLGTPMVVCYRLSPLSSLIAPLLVTARWISLPNIIANRAVVPELLQDHATGTGLAEEAMTLLKHPERLRAQREAFKDLKQALGAPGVGERAASRVLEAAGYVR